jgi:FtsH-binding integral membrane protein
LKKILHALGTLIGISGLVFIALRLYSYADQIDISSISVTDAAIVICLAVAYGTANLFLARGWWHLLCWQKIEAGWPWSLKAYAISQLAKYIPGNILQFAGRQALGVAAGISHRVLLQSSLLELTFQSISGAMFAPLVVSHFLPIIDPRLGIAVFCLVLVFLGCVIFVFLSSHLARAAINYAAQVGTSGTIFLCVLLLVGGQVTGPYGALMIIGSFAISWLTGMLTPGAPAGLGVREAMLVFLLEGMAPSSFILVAALLGRVVTTLGDLLFFVLGRIDWIHRVRRSNPP